MEAIPTKCNLALKNVLSQRRQINGSLVWLDQRDADAARNPDTLLKACAPAQGRLRSSRARVSLHSDVAIDIAGSLIFRERVYVPT